MYFIKFLYECLDFSEWIRHFPASATTITLYCSSCGMVL